MPINLFQAALCRWLASDAIVDSVRTLPDIAQDHSDAIVRFYDVAYHSSAGTAEIRLITKAAHLYERQICALLNSQAHPNVPWSYTFDLHTNVPFPVCQQYVGLRLPLSQQHMHMVAQALAKIHAINCGAPYLPWMRRLTSTSFFSWWRPMWEQALAHQEFRREFYPYLAHVEFTAKRFADLLDDYWQEHTCLTVLHTDLSAWHVLVHDGQPYLIDWDQARYGPLYLDLVNFWTPETIPIYYEALVAAGVFFPYSKFMTHYYASRVFVSLKYMVPALQEWLGGERVKSCEQLHHFLSLAAGVI